MGNKVHFIVKIQNAFELITQGLSDLNDLTENCSEEEFRMELLKYIAQYAYLNYNMSMYLILKLAEAIKFDKETEDFNSLMKDFD